MNVSSVWQSLFFVLLVVASASFLFMMPAFVPRLLSFNFASDDRTSKWTRWKFVPAIFVVSFLPRDFF